MESLDISRASPDFDIWHVPFEVVKSWLHADRFTALNSLAFQCRAELLHYLPLEKIKLAAENWKRIWDAVIGSLDKEQYLHLGYPKHAEELWWLLTATLDVTSKSDTSFPYLDSTATDELWSLNDFIQWCHRRAQ